MNTQLDNSEQLKSILGEIPNYIFEYLELSDDIKKEWRLGSKASDFGGHNQFVQKYAQRIEKVIEQAVSKARIEVIAQVLYEQGGTFVISKRTLTEMPRDYEVEMYDEPETDNRVYRLKSLRKPERNE